MREYAVLVLCVLLLAGCGYRFSNASSLDGSIAVPFVEGDEGGVLTSALINKLVLCGFSYDPSEFSYTLKVQILSDSNEHIGYQYDVNDEDTSLIKRLVPNEGRRKIRAKVEVLNSAKTTVIGPFEVEATADYDFVNSDSLQDLSFINADGERDSILSYSLGQLDSRDGARDASFSPVFKALSEKIVRALKDL